MQPGEAADVAAQIAALRRRPLVTFDIEGDFVKRLPRLQRRRIRRETIVAVGRVLEERVVDYHPFGRRDRELVAAGSESYSDTCATCACV